jgi:hypothetical protein
MNMSRLIEKKNKNDKKSIMGEGKTRVKRAIMKPH